MEYKVVWVTQRRAEIWTLGCSTSWRCIGNIPYSIHGSSTRAGFFARGALHWWKYDNPRTIVSMSMETEKFSAIELSLCFSVTASFVMIEWNGRLAVSEEIGVAPDFCYSSCNLWVLKEEKTLSWSKVLSFRWKREYGSNLNFWTWSCHQYEYCPLCVQTNGEILVLDVRHNRLLSHNMKKRSSTHVRALPPRFAEFFLCDSVHYVPSFVGWNQEPERKKVQVAVELFDQQKVHTRHGSEHKH